MGVVTGDFNGDSYSGHFLSEVGDFTKLLINPDSTGYLHLYPDSSKAIFNRDGLQTAFVDRNGNTTTYEYDEEQRLISIRNPGALATRLEYGEDGLLDRVTDPANRVTRFDHDSAGDLIAVTDPDGSIWRYAYDGRHLLTAATDPRGYATTYEYDENGYVTRIVGPEGPGREAPTNRLLASDSKNTLNEAIAQGYGTPEHPALPSRRTSCATSSSTPKGTRRRPGPTGTVAPSGRLMPEAPGGGGSITRTA